MANAQLDGMSYIRRVGGIAKHKKITHRSALRYTIYGGAEVLVHYTYIGVLALHMAPSGADLCIDLIAEAARP